MLREIFQKKKKKMQLSIHVEMMIRGMTFVCKTYLGKDEKGKKSSGSNCGRATMARKSFVHTIPSALFGRAKQGPKLNNKNQNPATREPLQSLSIV